MKINNWEKAAIGFVLCMVIVAIIVNIAPIINRKFTKAPLLNPPVMPKNFAIKGHLRLKKENLNYKVLVYNDINKQIKQVKADNGLDVKACTISNPKTKDLGELFDIVESCSVNACIINTKKREYVMLNRNENHILNELKKYSQKNI